MAVVASRCFASPGALQGDNSMTSATQSTAPWKLPVESLNGFASAKSQTIGIAWRAKVLRVLSLVTSHEQIVEFLSANLSTANARYVATASAYAFAPVPPSLSRM